jgi:hypothetical protein
MSNLSVKAAVFVDDRLSAVVHRLEHDLFEIAKSQAVILQGAAEVQISLQSINQASDVCLSRLHVMIIRIQNITRASTSVSRLNEMVGSMEEKTDRINHRLDRMLVIIIWLDKFFSFGSALLRFFIAAGWPTWALSGIFFFSFLSEYHVACSIWFSMSTGRVYEVVPIFGAPVLTAFLWSWTISRKILQFGWACIQVGGGWWLYSSVDVRS